MTQKLTTKQHAFPEKLHDHAAVGYHYLCADDQDRTGNEDSAQKHHGTLRECCYLFHGEAGPRRTHSEKEVFQGQTCLRRKTRASWEGCMSLEKRELTPDPGGGLGIKGSKRVTFCSPGEH